MSIKSRRNPMNCRWWSLLERIMAAAGSLTVNQAKATLERLSHLASDRTPSDLHLLLPFGGGKDSAWVLAYVRLMQLLLRMELGYGFKLDVYLMIHPGVPQGVFDNINAVLASLEVDGDDDVDVVATTRGGVSIDLTEGRIPRKVVEGFRNEILISGHLARGNGRETFCNACNLALMSEIARFVEGRNGSIDVVITGDSMREVTSYWRWVQRACSRFRLQRVPSVRSDWGTLFSQLSGINNAYYCCLYGQIPETTSFEGFIDITRDGLRTPNFFSLFEETRHEYYDHQEFLEQFLGFRLREDAFNFTESDCRNPLLMAHLRGLLSEFEGVGYIEGVREYLHLVNHLMVNKTYSEEMISLALSHYRTGSDILERRLKAEAFASSAYSLSPAHLEAMVASPLTDGGRRLDRFLAWRYSDCRAIWPDIRQAVSLLAASPIDTGQTSDDSVNIRCHEFLKEVTGMDEYSLRLVARRSTSSGCTINLADPLSILRNGDPHKMELLNSKIDVNRIITGR